MVELYDPGYVAKRMEIGAVIGASPKANVVRDVPAEGDIIVLLGGSTGPVSYTHLKRINKRKIIRF